MHSLFTRVFASFWIAIVAFVVVATAITAANFLADVSEPRAVTRQAENVLREDGLDGLRTWLTERNARLRRQRTLVIDESGRDILGQEPPRHRRRPPPPGAALDGMPHGPPGGRIYAADGTRFIVMFDPPPRRGPFSPPFSPFARAVLLGLAILISGLVSYLLARSISRPLVDLQGTARTLAAGRLGARTSPAVAARTDEIGALAREFDSMAERLAALVAARQQLLRDLSHELRSPLARLQMAVGLARQDHSRAETQLERIERESDRLEGLIAQILNYARLERDPSTLERQEVDLVELVRQVVHDAEYESQSPPGRIDLRVVIDQDPGRIGGTGSPAAAPSPAITETMSLRADPQLMHAAFDNLLRNALLHGGDGPIEVTLEANPDRVIATVRDHGPGVPEAELERIFEPFYRVQGGAQQPRRDGTGIGLAVAAKAIALHGGHIVAEPADGGGLRMRISLPRDG